MQTWRMKLLFRFLKYPLPKYFDPATRKIFFGGFLFGMAERSLQPKYLKKSESS